MRLHSKILLLITPVVTLSSVVLGYVIFNYWSSQSMNLMAREASSLLADIKNSIHLHSEYKIKSLESYYYKSIRADVLSSGSVDGEKRELLSNKFGEFILSSPEYASISIKGKNIDLEVKKDVSFPDVDNNKSNGSVIRRIDNDFYYLHEYVSTDEMEHSILLVERVNLYTSFAALKAYNPRSPKIIITSEKVRGKGGIIHINNGNYFQRYTKIGEGNYIRYQISIDDYISEAKEMGFIVLIVSILIGLVISILLVFFINKTILRRIDKLKLLVNKIENNDFSFTVTDHTNDELGELLKHMCKMSSAIKDSKSKIHKLAYTDALTGLGNRVQLGKDIKLAINSFRANDNSLAVFLIDVDNFKEVNDCHGHHTGDILLQEISKKLENSISKFSQSINCSRCKAYRMAGDEFIVIIESNSNENTIKNLLEDINIAFKEPIKINGSTFGNTISIGAAIAPLHGDDRHTLLKNADIAMYSAKGSGKGSYKIFNEDIYNEFYHRSNMEKKIAFAIENDCFEMHYQPKVDACNLQIREFEALIRWKGNKENYASPGVFIPFAEESGQIEEISKNVIEKVCRDTKILELRGWSDFKVSFNLSQSNLQSKSILQKLQSEIVNSGINPRHLEVEITEHCLASNLDETKKNLLKLKEMGIGISLDDFGTGYSSLAHLELMPIDTIKIDKTFIRDCHNHPTRKAVINTIITFAKGFNMRCVAEGVETDEECKEVRAMGCDLIQGFRFYKPLQLDSAIALYENRIKKAC